MLRLTLAVLEHAHAGSLAHVSSVGFAMKLRNDFTLTEIASIMATHRVLTL